VGLGRPGWIQGKQPFSSGRVGNDNGIGIGDIGHRGNIARHVEVEVGSGKSNHGRALRVSQPPRLGGRGGAARVECDENVGLIEDGHLGWRETLGDRHRVDGVPEFDEPATPTCCVESDSIDLDGRNDRNSGHVIWTVAFWEQVRPACC